MLPTRDGVGPSQVALPAGSWANMLDFLVERFPAIRASDWLARMAGGDVVDAQGARVTPQQAYLPHSKLFYYRSVPGEAPNPAQAQILFEDAHLVVADKPHFLPVTPSGNYLQETLLVRLRRELGIDALAPLHRIDRETAGLVLFAKQPESRGPYTQLFAERAVAKTYEAIAPWNAQLPFPLTRSSRLVDSAHFMQMMEAPQGAPPGNAATAVTDIAVLEVQGAWARYRLQPRTGRRHQLRVHMAALGLPILGDRIYPVLLPEGGDDIANPLRLLAQSLVFTDPLTGQERRFTTQQVLAFPGCNEFDSSLRPPRAG